MMMISHNKLKQQGKIELSCTLIKSVLSEKEANKLIQLLAFDMMNTKITIHKQN